MANQNDMRTPLSRVRGLGSAREGTEHFWRQRLTAIANIPLLGFFIFVVVKYDFWQYKIASKVYVFICHNLLF